MGMLSITKMILGPRNSIYHTSTGNSQIRGLRAWKMKNSIKMMESDMPADSGRRAKNKAEQEIPGGYC